MSVQQHIAARLKSDNLTADECRELDGQAGSRITEVRDRLAQIGKGRNALSTGRERQWVLTEGTPEQLAELDLESELLSAELESLEHQRNALSKRRQELLGQAAIRDMPKRYKSLSEALDVAAKRRAAYVESLRGIESQIRDIEAARAEAARAGMAQPPAADASLYAKLDTLAPGPELSSGFLHGRHSRETLASALGVQRAHAA